MGSRSLRWTIEDAALDALDDLGSTAVLEALCDGPPHRAGLLEAMRASEAAAADTFVRWRETAAGAPAAAAYTSTAARERDHERRIVEALSTPRGAADAPVADAPSMPGPLHAYLRGLEDPAARVGAGLVGRPLASLRIYDQVRGWAETEGDASLVALVADLTAETEPSFGTAAELLGDARPGEDRWRTAVAAGTYAVRLVRDDHADTLAGLGRSFG